MNNYKKNKYTNKVNSLSSSYVLTQHVPYEIVSWLYADCHCDNPT